MRNLCDFSGLSLRLAFTDRENTQNQAEYSESSEPKAKQLVVREDILFSNLFLVRLISGNEG